MANSSTRRYKKRALFDATKCRGYAPCSYCGRKLTFAQATLDHVFPQLLGGRSGLGNLVLACEKCNNSKSSYVCREGKKDSHSTPNSLIELIDSLSQSKDESTS
jgi:5-methylcytosine-specific restriction endonuclease McrA